MEIISVEKSILIVHKVHDNKFFNYNNDNFILIILFTYL